MYDIRKVQLVQLDILKQVIALCEKHNIKYYAVYGTLLGAIRHKGFIPWDDDIDIAMLRPDFDRFCEIAEKELPQPYFLQTNKTDPEYHLHIARVQNLNTTLIEQAYCHLNIKFGMSVDIYPLDGMIKNKKEFWHYKFWNKIYSICMTSWNDDRRCLKKYIKLFLGKMINIFLYANKPTRYFWGKTEQLYRRLPVAEGDCVIDFHDALIKPYERIKINIFEKADCAKREQYQFEDISIFSFANYGAVLKNTFGDYMQLPPEKDRIQHHNWVAVDTEKSYTEYVNR